MIESVSITNFKSLRDATAHLGLFTVLLGPNGSGKSSLLQALMLLKQSLGQGGMSWSGPYIALGHFLAIIRNHDPNADLKISFTGQSRAERGVVLRIRDYRFHYELTIDRVGLRQHEGTISKDSEQLLRGLWERNQRANVTYNGLGSPEGIGLTFQPTVGIGSPFTGFPSHYPQDKFSIVEEVRIAVDELVQAYTRAINGMFLVPAVRGVDRPDVDLIDAPVNDFVTVRGSDAQASNLASTLGYDPELADRVSIFTKKITGVAIRHRLVPNRRTSIEALEPPFSSNLVNQGSGLNQLVFSFSQLARAPSRSLVGIEEPELHLHPRAQSELIDALVDIARAEDKQVVVTTHSEHILFRLLTKVARGELTPGQLSVLRFDKEDKTTSTVTQLKIDSKGSIEGGLPGFFEEDVREFQDYLNALSQPKKNPP